LVTGGTAGIGRRAAQVLREQGGKLDVLVLAANLEGTILATQALLPVLKAARGSVINFSSGLVSFLVSPQAQWITGARVSPR
jgi:NAD(P)-dependent dehydrogenase (short-subunit alcohol dehydrogenase family)